MSVKTLCSIAVMLLLTLALATQAIADDATVATSVSSSRVTLTAEGKASLDSIVKNNRKEWKIVQPPEVADLIETLDKCTATLPDWRKEEFLRDWREAEVDINSVAKKIFEQAALLRAGDHPFVNAQAAKLQSGGGLTLPKETQEFLDEAKRRGINITVFEVQGIKGKPVVDPEVLSGSKLVTNDDIMEAMSNFIVAALPRLYERFTATPIQCWSPDQLKTIRDRLLPMVKSIRRLPDQSGFEQIECGKAGTYSRFTVPLSKLSDPVINASKNGPWPYGPAGFYFSKSWFMRHAVGQMFARESGRWRDGLTVDVADYICGKP